MAGKYDNLIDEVTTTTPAPQTPVQTPADRYGDLIDEVTSAAPLHTSLFDAMDSNPQEEAKKRKLSKQLNTPAAVLPADAEQRALLQQTDAEQIQQRTPATAKFLTNPDNAKVTGLKGVKSLSDIELAAKSYNPDNIKQFIRNYTATGKSAAEASQKLAEMKVKGIDLADYNDPFRRQWGEVLPDLGKQIVSGTDRMFASMAELSRPLNRLTQALGLALGATSEVMARGSGEPFFDVARTSEQNLEETQRTLNETAKYWQDERSTGIKRLNEELNKAGPLDAVGLLIQHPSLLADQLAQSVPYLATGALSAQGGEMTVVAANSLIEAADAANSAREEAIAAGATKEQQDKAATAAALVAAPLVFLGNKFLGTGKLEARFFTKGTTGHSLLQAAVREFISGSIEEGANQLGSNVGAATYDENQQLLEGVGKAALLGGVLESTHAVGMSAAGRALQAFIDDADVAVQTANNRQDMAAEAEAVQATMTDLGKLASRDELRQNDPESFRMFTEMMTDETDLKEVYVDGQTALAAIESEYGTLRQSAPELVQAIEEAANNGTDVAISVPDYLTAIAGTQAEGSILPELKADPNGATYSQAQEFYQKQSEVFQSEVSAVEAANEPVLTREQFEATKPEGTTYEQYLTDHVNKREVYARDAESVEAKILDQFQTAGRFTAPINRTYTTPIVEFYKTQAKRMGIMPSELYARYPFKVQSLVNFNKKTDLTQPEFFAKTTTDYVRNSGFADNITPEGNLIVYHGTSIKNEKGIESSGKFNGFPFFSPDRTVAERFAKQAGGKPTVMALVIDPSTVLPTGGYLSARMEGLSKGTDGVWRLSKQEAIPQTETEAFKRWFGDSKVVDAEGKPLVVYHGTKADITKFEKYKNPFSAGQGFYFSPLELVANNFAQSEGGNVVPVYLNIRNPYIAKSYVDAARLSDERISELKAQGYDGAYFKPNDEVNYFQEEWVAFDPEQIKSAIGNRGTFDPNSANILNQGEYKDLIAQHNLSVRSLLHADKMGGLAVPSLAVTKKETPLTGFGEITLLAAPEVVDPKGYARAKVYGADIYSPRYPSITYLFTANMRKRAEAMLKDGMEATDTRYIDWQEIEKNGAEDLSRTAPFMWQFLRDEGIEQPIIRTNPEPLPKPLQSFAETSLDYFDLKNDPDFVEAAYKAQFDIYAPTMGVKEAKARIAELKENAKESGRQYLVEEYARDVDRYRRDIKDAGKIDTNATRYAMEKVIRERDLTDKVNQAARDFIDDIGPNEKIFQGYTYSGNRKYIDHTLENVVKSLKKDLRGGEGWNYGLGSVRAKFTPQFKSLAEIRKNKDRLMDSAAFENVKKDLDTELEAIGESLAPYHPGSEKWGFLDTLTGMISDAATVGVRRALSDNGFSNVPDEVALEVGQFMEHLRTMPAEYFEAKILREVDLAEFSGAVVPEGVDQKVIDVLRRRGVTDIRYYNKNDENSRKEAIGKFENLFFQENQDRIRGTFNIDTLTVSLLNGADLSTVIHESGHFYLRMLQLLANDPNAPKEIVDDYLKALNWFGVLQSTWESMTLDEQRPYHEQWAESFELWNLEGQAPTQELQPIFSRFRAWLLSVYKSVEDFLRRHPNAGKLNDEVRGVFSRLVASEDAIRVTEAARAFQPLFTSSEDAGVPQAEVDKYLELGSRATEDATAQLQARSLRDMRWLSNARSRAIKDLQDKSRLQRDVIRREVTAEVMAEPVNQARTFLRTGKINDPNSGEQVEVLEGFKLDKKILEEMYPEGALDRPDLSTLRGMTAKEGLDPDTVAGMFGFTSGDALVRTIISDERPADKIAGLTDKRMLEEYGDLVDQMSIERAADEAVHNEARARFVATGLKILSKSPVSVTQLNKAAKNAAESQIATKRVRDLRPKQYLAAETKANKAALAAVAKNPQEAARQQRTALLNNRLAMAAQDAVIEVEKAIKYLGKFNNEGTRKNLDIEYLEQIDAMLEPFDLRKGLSLSTIDAQTTLAEWVQQQEAMGFEPTVDPEAMAAARGKSYKNMTMAELRGLVDTVKQIEHMGRMKKKLLTAQERADFAERIAEAKASIAVNANRSVPEKGTPTDAVGLFGQWYRQMAAAHRKFASYIRELDGGKMGGVMYNLMLRGASSAASTESEMRAQASDKLGELFSRLPTRFGSVLNMVARKKQIPGTTFSLTDEERVMFAMNWGNEGNRQRLLDGGITGHKAISPGEAQAVLDTLSKEEWDFVQGVWDFIAEYKPLIADLERTLTGKTPEWIEASPIETKYGTYPGGYFPAKYDAVLSTRSDSLEAATDLRSAMRGAFGAAAAKNGYTKERAAQVVGRPLLLNFNAISRHVNEVIHRVAWQPWLIDANRVLRALDSDLRQTLGAEATKEIRDTVVDIARGDAPATTPVEVAINHIRTGTSIVGMGWKITTALLQPSGLTNSFARIGGRYMARGLSRYLANPILADNWVNENSALMRNRGRTMNREMNEILNTVRKDKTSSLISASYFYLIGKMQRMVDVPTYLGAYERALEELNFELAQNQTQRDAITKKAHDIAGQAVKDTQGGGELMDLAKAQRGSPIMKLFTNFYSYMNTVYNMNVEAFRTTNFKSPTELALFSVEMMLINIMPVMFSVALKNLLKGECSWDDTECLLNRYKSEQISHFFGQVLLLREIGVSVDVATGGEAFGYSGPAGLRFFADLYKTGQQASQGEVDMPLFKAANNAAGALFHYPAAALNNVFETILAVENGEIEGAQILPSLVAGPPRN